MQRIETIEQKINHKKGINKINIVNGVFEEVYNVATNLLPLNNLVKDTLESFSDTKELFIDSTSTDGLENIFILLSLSLILFDTFYCTLLKQRKTSTHWINAWKTWDWYITMKLKGSQ